MRHNPTYKIIVFFNQGTLNFEFKSQAHFTMGDGDRQTVAFLVLALLQNHIGFKHNHYYRNNLLCGSKQT